MSLVIRETRSQAAANVAVHLPPSRAEAGEGTQRCFVTQHGRHSTGQLLEEGHGSALQSCPLLTACYTWIQMSSKAPCAKAQVLRMGVQWGGGDISLWFAVKYSKRPDSQQADLIIERLSDHEGFDPASGSISY